jgi:hypothetical protein
MRAYTSSNDALEPAARRKINPCSHRTIPGGIISTIKPFINKLWFVRCTSGYIQPNTSINAAQPETFGFFSEPPYLRR